MTLSPRSYLLCSGLVTACVVGAMWLYTSLMPMYFLEGGYPIWVAKQALLRSCGFGSVLVMGDSRPESAIIPLQLGMPAANISSGAATPIENYFFAREALRCPTPPSYVVYSHSISSFGVTNEFLWTNATRYGFITFKDLREIAGVAAALHDDSLPGTNTHDGLTGIVRDVLYSSGFPTVFTASLLKARGFGRYHENSVLLQRTAAERGGVIYPDNSNHVVGLDAEVKHFVSSPIQAYYFEKTLEMLAAAGVKVLYVPIPDSDTTVKAMAAGPEADFAAFLKQNTEAIPNVAVTTPAIIGWPDDLFVDGSHMNRRGAMLFTQRVAACLAQSRSAPVRCDLVWK